jgi:hypothetical protein
MDEFERKKRELLTPLYFEAGAALMDCQHFEYGLRLLLLHFARLGHPGLDPTAMFRIMEDQDKKTAGQLIAMIKKHLQIHSSIETALAEGLDARNRIIHRIFIESIEMVPKAETRASLIKEIRRLRRKVRDADGMLSPIIVGLGEELDAISYHKLVAEAKALFS